MSRYIDADKLSLDINDTEFWEQHDRDVAMRCVQIAETADVQEVKHGKWETYFEGKELMCSCCKASFYDADKSGGTNFCPNCGAKMDGDEK